MRKLFYLLSLSLICAPGTGAQDLVTYPAPQGVVYSQHNDDYTVKVRKPGGEWQDLLSIGKLKIIPYHKHDTNLKLIIPILGYSLFTFDISRIAYANFRILMFHELPVPILEVSRLPNCLYKFLKYSRFTFDDSRSKHDSRLTIDN